MTPIKKLTMLNGNTPPVEPDQPGLQNETVYQYLNTSSGTAAAFNYDAVGTTTDSLTARQLYAQHLYTLMMLNADLAALDQRTGSRENSARLIAQWAVNCVAFRDHNSIMIPFNYVVDPVSTGWKPDGTVLHTVWGCKRPDLVISETLAFHDRRTQDLSNEVFDSKKGTADGITWTRTAAGLTTDTAASKKKDPSFNSKYRPQGSLFVELFNPWPTMEPRTLDLAPANGAPGVELTKVATVGKKSSPVWRLVIVDPSLQSAPANGDELPDPDDPIVANRPTIERAAYFVSLTGMTTPPKETKVDYCVSTNRTVVVAPGGYAVVGSGDSNQNNRTFIGFENGQTAGIPTSTRMVTMNPADFPPSPSPPSPALCVVKNTTAANPSANVPQVLGIDSPQRLSVSEPTKGYTTYEKPAKGTATYNAATGQYSVTLDIPVDQQRYLITKKSSTALRSGSC